jgi:hypothetical protein
MFLSSINATIALKAALLLGLALQNVVPQLDIISTISAFYRYQMQAGATFYYR